ncbi:MAG: hypothetical protein GQ546_02050 [Gammaproteobacteria bacterium]|nr:hypothetical protein [Gammaproteobacteria bacterium]
MKVLLFLVISGISNGSDTEFRHQMEKQYNTVEECVQTSIIMRKVLRAEDNLQARQTDVFAHCEVSKEGISEQEYAQANSKIRRLEKFYTTAKW